jgi:hypothetical protein
VTNVRVAYCTSAAEQPESRSAITAAGELMTRSVMAKTTSLRERMARLSPTAAEIDEFFECSRRSLKQA